MKTGTPGKTGSTGKAGKALSPTAVGVAAVWGVVVILVIQGAQSGVHGLKRQREELAQLTQRLIRLQGWCAVESHVRSRLQAALGPLAAASSAEAGWFGLAKIEELAQAERLAVTELRPSRVAAVGKHAPETRWDLKLEGELPALSRFLQQIPEQIPGVKLAALQFVPLEGARRQLVVRLQLAPPSL